MTVRGGALAGLALAAAAAAGCGEAESSVSPPVPVEVPAAAKPLPVAPPEDTEVALLVRAGSDRLSVRQAALREIEGDAGRVRDAARRELAASYVLLRRGAGAALSRIADESCAAEILAALGRARETEVPDLVAALGRSGARQAGAHLAALVSGDDERRGLLAANALSEFKGPLDLAPLRAAAREDQPSVVRRSAFIALSGHASADDEDFFRTATQDPLTPVRAAASKCLLASPGLTSQDVRRLVVLDPEEAVRATAAQAAAKAPGAVVIAPLAEALATLDPEDDAVAESLKSLAAHRERAAFDVLLAYVQDDTMPGELRGSALRGLARIDRERTVAFLKMESAVFDTELRAYSDEILPPEKGRR